MNERTRVVAEKVKKVYVEEEIRKKSKKIVMLDEIPDLTFRPVVIRRNPNKSLSKYQKIIDYVEENYLMEIFNQDMQLYDSSLLSTKELQKLSYEYNVDFGMLHGIKGKFSKTIDPDLDEIIKRLDNLRKTKSIKKELNFVEVIELPEKVKQTFSNPSYQRIQTILGRRRVHY